MDRQFYNRKEAARVLSERGIQTAPATLAKLATMGGGPEMSKFGRRVLYTPASLDSWITSRLVTCRTTSQLPKSQQMGAATRSEHDDQSVQ